MAWEPDYVTLAEAKNELRIDDTIDDTTIQRKITAASRAIDLFCGRQFGQVAVAEDRYYTPWYDEDLRRWVAEIDDLMDLTGFTLAVDVGDDETFDEMIAVTNYVLRPRNAVVKNRPYTQLALLSRATAPMLRPDSVRGHGKWGWSAIPTTIAEATLLQVSRLLWRRDAPAGVAGSPESGSEVRLLARLDPDVEVMIKEYRRVIRP
jgi:gp6-like head-tail connector protein